MVASSVLVLLNWVSCVGCGGWWCSIRVFAAAAVVGVGVLVPVNFMGDQLRLVDFADLPNKSLDLFSVSNVQDGSNK